MKAKKIGSPITHLQFVADDSRLVVGTMDFTYILSREGEVLRRVKWKASRIAASPDGHWLLGKVEGPDSRVHSTRIILFDLERRKWRDYGHFKANGLAFSDDNGRFALVGYLDDYALINPEDGFWKVFGLVEDSFEEEYGLFRNCREMHGVAFLPDGSGLVTGGKGRQCTVWNWEGEALERYVNEMSMRVAVPHSGKYLVSGSVRGALDIWDRDSGQLTKSLKVADPQSGKVLPSSSHSLFIQCCGIAKYGNRTFIGGSNILGTCIFDAHTLELHRFIPGYPYFCFARNEPFVALGNQEGRMEISSIL